MPSTTVTEEERAAWNNGLLYKSTTEHPEEVIIKFSGQLPSWLHGTLYRNGPGQNEINNDPATGVYHAFDGFAYIQKYFIDGASNSVAFRSSFIKSRSYTESLKSGHLITRQFGTDPCKSIFGRFQSLFINKNPHTFTDDTGVTVQKVHDELLALTETTIGYALDPDTLKTIAPLTTLPYTKKLDGEIMTLATAHVMHDDKRKMTVGYASRISKTQHQLDVIFIDDEVKEKATAKALAEDNDDWISVDGRFILITQNMSEKGKQYNHDVKSSTKLFRYDYPQACYMHSASLTENYLILTEIPLHFSMLYAAWTTVSGGSIPDMFKFNSALPTYFRVINLDSGKEVARIAGPSFFNFHHINSYEDNEQIVVDICAYDDHRTINEFYLNTLRKNIFRSGSGYVRRFILNLTDNTCIEPHAKSHSPEGSFPISRSNSLVPVQFELPRINPTYLSKKYRFFYGVRAPPGRLLDALIKIDVEKRELVGLWEQAYTSPSEPIFVPRPGAQEEEDGVVLSVILDQKAEHSFLLVLDGKTFEEVARAQLPIHIALSFHGSFCS